MIWDEGTWEPIGDPDEGLAKGDLKFRLDGKRLKGDFVLVRMKPRKEDRGRQNWLLIKKRDDYAGDGDEPTETYDTSARSGRTMEQIRSGDVPIWTSTAQKNSGAARKATRGRGKSQSESRPRASSGFRRARACDARHRSAGRAELAPRDQYDGYRIVGRKAGDAITLFSRSGLDWTVRFPIAKALLTFPATSALRRRDRLRAAFGRHRLQIAAEHIDSPHGSIRYFVFDLLFLDGKDWRKKPLKERRAKLASLMEEKGVSNFLVYADYVDGAGRVLRPSLRGGTRRHRVEARRPALRLGPRQGLAQDQMQARRGIRNRRLQPLRCRGKPFSSLLLGEFSRTASSSMPARSAPDSTRPISRRCRDDSSRWSAPRPLSSRSPPRSVRGAVWLEPKLVCQVSFAERTRDGRLRHPSYKGTRGQAGARSERRGAGRRGGEHGEERFEKDEPRFRRHPHQSRPRAVPRYRLHQARSRPLLRNRRAAHAALRRAASDQPRALPEGYTRSASSSAMR